MKTRKMPIGIQDFASLIEDGYIYVDKTAFIYKLIKEGKHYFLSRPRRFGKSLLITTLEAYFLGKKELFKGLAIENLEKDWITYPVLHFDFNGQNYSSPDGLNEIIKAHLRQWEKCYDCPKQSESFGIRLADIIKAAHEKTGQKVVVLVDEYDKPLLETLTLSQELIEQNRATFKGMFGQLKSLDGYLRFVFFTGVTKFSKVSIFSDLNQLQDISMHPQYAEICGITQSELETTFAPEIDAMANENNLTHDECLAKLKRFYDGYKFSEKCENIYNPFSLINAFSSLKFGKFWFSTGTPTFLVKHLNEMGFNPKQFSDGSLYASEDEITDYRPDNPDIIPLLYQSGYLTIREYDERRDRFVLEYPNDEVKYGFMNSLAVEYLHLKRQSANNDIFAIDDALEAGDTDSLKDQFVSLFASLPYPANPSDSVLERDFQNVVYLVFLLLGQFVKVEQHSAKGRADCIVETDEYVYIFEFKRDDTAENALSQIDEAGYAKPYEADTRKLIKIGAVFSSKERTLTEWLVKA